MLKCGKIILFLSLSSIVFAQSVDENELRRRDLNSIVFRNYVGPLTVVNTAQEIRSIGYGLAAGVQNRERFTWAGRYSVLRVYAPQDPKMSADIIIIEPTARVDHINGLNLIIGGYLERTFNYSREDARVLANFVTRYNALFRGNLDFFRQNYADAVVQNLSAENAGLSTFYADWPGKSRIVIPLRSSLSMGPRGLIDADEVSRPEVTQSMPQTPETLQERRDIVNIREREIQREERAIQEREEQLRQTQNQPTQPQQGTQNQQQNQPPTNNQQNPPNQNQPNQQQGPTNNQGQQNQGEQPQNQQQNQQQQPSPQQQQQEIQQAREELQRREENLQRDRQEIQQQEQQIAQAREQSPPAEREQTEPVLFLYVDRDPSFAQLMILDARGRRSLVKSDLNTIRGRRFVTISDGFLVIAGREGGNAAVRLVVLDKEKLTMLRTGQQDIHPDSDLVVQGQNIYAVLKDGTRFRLGIFDQALNLVRQSAIEVKPQTAIQVQGQRLLVQSTEGTALFLNPTTLEQIFEVRP